jgi:hypothetical protein
MRCKTVTKITKSFRKSVPHIAVQWKMKMFHFTNVTDSFQIRLTFVTAEYASWGNIGMVCTVFKLFFVTKTLPEIIDYITRNGI